MLSLPLQESLDVAIKVNNKTKANAYNAQLFWQLCEVNNKEFYRLLLHTEVRWMLKS